MLHIDGSQGEGGGQILRSALALSLATGTPFRISSIRAGREKPGLMRQHLTCIQAAAAISSARVTGADVGSREVSFAPGAVKPGTYHFPIGTAGSTTMVLQAILPALLTAGPSTIVVEGGTHNGSAPPFEFFAGVLLPLLRRAGARIEARLEAHGFYPAGGGRIAVDILEPGELCRLELCERGKLLSRCATVLVSRLPGNIGERESAVLRDRLGLDRSEVRWHTIETSPGPGNALIVEHVYEHITEVFSAVGERGKSAEAVAAEAANQARDYVKTLAPVGQHLADQLMVPLALLAGGRYATGPLTPHSTTNAHILNLFSPGIVTLSDTEVSVRALGRTD